MKHAIVYFPYELQTNPRSGSGVRPKRMVEAFTRFGERENLKIVVISGQSRARKERIREYLENHDVKDAQFCYMETSTMPYWLTDKDHVPRAVGLDYPFWKKLKDNGVAIGCFYRDVYWQFDDMYVPPFRKKALTPIMRNIYRKELSTYHKVLEKLYLPSLEMNRFVQWEKDFDELPPGMGHATSRNHELPEVPTAIYVGGITDTAGILNMLEAFRILNHDAVNVKLQFICRDFEFEKYPEVQKFKDEPWISIQHLSGDALHEVYKTADLALIPYRKNTYHDFAMPVKLFEYLSYSLPIVATNCDAQSRFIEDNHFGVTAAVTKEDFAEAVKQALKPEIHQELVRSIQEHAFEKNSWDARVQKVAHDLTAARK
ncbi:glycosyltransferase [Metabacillus sp. 113a]|uniref:glycosyltransferase n=1 Tax=Metabacillus sp. 113a TaxID=3404706 RepID=UPI003CF126A1